MPVHAGGGGDGGGRLGGGLGGLGGGGLGGGGGDAHKGSVFTPGDHRTYTTCEAAFAFPDRSVATSAATLTPKSTCVPHTFPFALMLGRTTTE